MELEKIVKPNELGEEQSKAESAKKQSFLSKILRDFGFGCIAFTPLAIFAVTIIFLVRYGKYLCSKIYLATDSSEEITLAIIVFLFLLIVYIGRKLRRSERSILSLLEKYVIEKIPVIGGWYETFSDLLKTFTSTGNGKYLGTVTIPVCGGYMIGFVTNSRVQEDGKKYLSVFVPTSPNPTTGLVLFLPEETVTKLDKTPEEAFSTIISLGVK